MREMMELYSLLCGWRIIRFTAKITSSWAKDGNAIPFSDIQEGDRWSNGKCREEP